MKLELKFLLSNLVYFQLFLFVVLPGGSIYGINIKLFTFLAFAFLFFVYLVLSKIEIKLYLLVIGLLVFVFFYTLIAFLPSKNAANIFTEVRLFVITAIFPMIVWHFLKTKTVSPTSLILIIIRSHILFLVLKLFFFLLVVLDIIQPNDIITVIDSMFGVMVMTLEIVPNITRIQLNLDLLSLIVFPLVLFSKELGLPISKRVQLIFHLLIGIGILVSFSRYIMVGYLLIFAIYTMLSLKNIRFVIGVGIVTSVLFFFTFDIIYEVVELRFSKKISSSSDYVRTEQFEALMFEFNQNPIIGNGFGGYSPEVIRDKEVVFSYELQLLSFLMKFGIVGFTIIMIVITIIVLPLFSVKDFRLKILLLLVYALWIASNIFNPYIISSMASVIFVVFVALPFLLFQESDSADALIESI